jgi:hypothetical protein
MKVVRESSGVRIAQNQHRSRGYSGIIVLVTVAARRDDVVAGPVSHAF